PGPSIYPAVHWPNAVPGPAPFHQPLVSPPGNRQAIKAYRGPQTSAPTSFHQDAFTDLAVDQITGITGGLRLLPLLQRSCAIAEFVEDVPVVLQQNAFRRGAGLYGLLLPFARLFILALLV